MLGDLDETPSEADAMTVPPTVSVAVSVPSWDAIRESALPPSPRSPPAPPGRRR